MPTCDVNTIAALWLRDINGDEWAVSIYKKCAGRILLYGVCLRSLLCMLEILAINLRI